MQTFDNYIPQPLAFYNKSNMKTPDYEYCAGLIGRQNTVYFNSAFFQTDDALVFSIWLPQFAIKRAISGASASSFVIKNYNTGTTAATLDPSLLINHDIVPTANANGRELFIYKESGFNQPLSGTIAENTPYYIQIVEGGNTWQSEVFYAYQTSENSTWWSCDDQFRLSWLMQNNCDLGNSYAGENTYTALLRGNLSQPEYDYFEDAQKNNDEDNVPLFQRVRKVYKIEIAAPEYMIDAINALPLYDYVTLDFPNGNSVIADAIQIDTPEWTEPCIAKTTIRFSINSLISSGCCGT